MGGGEDRFPRLAKGCLALADAELGHSDDARRGLQALTEQIPQFPRDNTSLAALALACLVATQLSDAEAARRLYLVLLPYGGHIIVITMPHPLVCFGSASLYLGLLATLTSRWTEAGDHFDAAIGVHEQLGARPLLARSRYEYARILLRRGQAADRDRAFGLLDQALATASSLGMVQVIEGIQGLREAQAGATVPTGRAAADTVVSQAAGSYVFRRRASTGRSATRTRSCA